MPLPRGLSPAEHGDAAVLVKPYPGGVRPIVSASFDIGCDAYSAQAAGRARLRKTPFEAAPAGTLLRALEVGCEIAGIVNLAGRRRIRHHLDEIPAPQLVRGDTHLACRARSCSRTLDRTVR